MKVILWLCMSVELYIVSRSRRVARVHPHNGIGEDESVKYHWSDGRVDDFSYDKY